MKNIYWFFFLIFLVSVMMMLISMGCTPTRKPECTWVCGHGELMPDRCWCEEDNEIKRDTDG